jgi:hypothetical protein
MKNAAASAESTADAEVGTKGGPLAIWRLAAVFTRGAKKSTAELLEPALLEHFSFDKSICGLRGIDSLERALRSPWQRHAGLPGFRLLQERSPQLLPSTRTVS